MLRSSQRLAVGVRRSETLGRLVFLSLALHLTLCVSLLIMPPPPAGAPERFSVDVTAEEGPAGAAAAPPASTEATAAPTAPVSQAEAQSPPPPPSADVPPPPTPPEPTPPPPVVEARPPRPIPAPPRRVAPRPATRSAPVNPAGAAAHIEGAPSEGAPAHAADGQNAVGRAGNASSANNGAAWMGKLKNWWDQHSFYPKEASQTNEGGNIRVRIVITAEGEVTSIQIVQGSGSSVLDAAAVAVFRNAHLPPPPPGAPPQPADVVVTLHYNPANNGG